MRTRRRRHDDERPRILVATPVKDAGDCLDTYVALLRRLTYPHRRLSIGLVESDSVDGTYAEVAARLPKLRREFGRVPRQDSSALS